MTYKIVLPTIDEALDALQKGKGTPLDRFIYDYEPEEYSECVKFRDTLENALQYAIEEQDTFRLTTDAPEMTVGDSSPITEPDPSEPCPNCDGKGYGYDSFGHRYGCAFCNKTGRVIPDKPE